MYKGKFNEKEIEILMCIFRDMLDTQLTEWNTRVYTAMLNQKCDLIRQYPIPKGDIQLLVIPFTELSKTITQDYETLVCEREKEAKSKQLRKFNEFKTKKINDIDKIAKNMIPIIHVKDGVVIDRTNEKWDKSLMKEPINQPNVDNTKDLIKQIRLDRMAEGKYTQAEFQAIDALKHFSGQYTRFKDIAEYCKEIHGTKKETLKVILPLLAEIGVVKQKDMPKLKGQVGRIQKGYKYIVKEDTNNVGDTENVRKSRSDFGDNPENE